MIKLSYRIIVHLLLLIVIDGWHFLGGTITWRPLNESATGTPVAVVITQTYSWTYSLMGCTASMIATNQLVPSYGGTLLLLTLDCIVNCGAGSAGYSSIAIIPYCTDFSAPVGTTVGQRSDIVYLAVGDDFVVAFHSGAWRPLTPGSGAPWSLSLHIEINPRSDNGLYNNAPVATVMSPIYLPVNQPKIINVPVVDADQDTIRCRWSINTNGTDECGGVCPPGSLPPNSVIFPNCTIIITGQVVGDWFGVALMVEDFINSTSTTPLSSVPVQFLVHVVPSSTCPPPQVIGLLPESSCTVVVVGQIFTSELIAINNCGPNVTIEDIATLSFTGMISTTVAPLNSTTYYKNLTWIPTSAQLGYQVMCAMAFDSASQQSDQYCFEFYVSLDPICSCPGDPCLSTTTTFNTTITTSTQKVVSINWPLIGSIIGVLCIVALLSCCCVCCCYLCPWLFVPYRHRRQGNIELYHFERCTDPDCPFIIDYQFNNINNCIESRISSQQSINSLKRIDGISISVVSKDRKPFNHGNPSIKPPIRQINQQTNRISLFTLTNEKILKTTENSIDVPIIRLRSKRNPIHRRSSINKCSRPVLNSTIYLNNDQQSYSKQDLINFSPTNNLISFNRLIPLGDLELARLHSIKSFKSKRKKHKKPAVIRTFTPKTIFNK